MLVYFSDNGGGGGGGEGGLLCKVSRNSWMIVLVVTMDQACCLIR